MATKQIKRSANKLCALILALVMCVAGVGCLSGCGSNAEGYTNTAQDTSAEKPQTASGSEQVTSFSNLKVGDTFAFGTYQDKSIGWQVLAVEDGKALVITQEGVDVKAFNDERGEYVWKNSTLRKWLNGDFLNAAFTADQQKLIQTTDVVNDLNPYWATGGSKNTQDKLFCLSITEAEKYFGREGDAACWPSDYASTVEGIYTNNSGQCAWWLRDAGYDVNQGESAANVDPDGFIFDSGAYVDKASYCVRPAMWVTVQ